MAVKAAAEVWLNGYGISGGMQAGDFDSWCQIPVTLRAPDNILKVGTNVLVLHARPSDISYLDAMVSAYVSPAAAPPAPSSRGGHVHLVSPTANMPVAMDSRVVFLWKPFPGAANYGLHIWMTKQQGAVTITAGFPTEFATTVYRRTDYSWNDQKFLPGVYHYALIPLDRHGNPLAGWSTVGQFLIVTT